MKKVCKVCGIEKDVGEFYSKWAKCKACVCAAFRERRKDPEYREKRNATKRAWAAAKVMKDPEYREKRNAAERERYANDPEYRERRKASKREWDAEAIKDPAKRLKYNQAHIKRELKQKGVQNPPEALIEVAALKRLIHQEIKSLTNKE